ncbi:asparagine synthase-related protein [Actinosynnema sp. NPDC059335]|uniref:asparagine synthase-related protein n=1 Tax=Actinosynnema sp. NPDC059335 TaxID=3346804 RepID=UPI0036704EE2
MGSPLIADHLGCSGSLVFDTAEVDAVQRSRPGAPQEPIRVAEDSYLLLSGPVKGPVTDAWARRIAVALEQGRHAELADVPGELCGCLVTPRKVFLFRNAESTEALLYRRDHRSVRWSTDPTDLLDPGAREFDDESLLRCCHGDDVFIYDGLTAVEPGEVVVVDEHRTTAARFDEVPPLPLPRRTTLPEYAELAYDLLLREARSYVGVGRVGLMLSGGLDSAAVLTAFVEAGVDVVVYHVLLDDPLADESAYARMVCEHLSVPLVLLRTDYLDDFLPTGRLPHPYLNYGVRWLEQLADRVRQDGITRLVWGRDGDLRFGPLTYGPRDVLFGDLRLREKAVLGAGLVSSHWELPRLLDSLRKSTSLLNDGSSGGVHREAADFLPPADDRPAPAPAFDVKDMCANLVVWRPRSIVMCNPLGNRDIQRLANRMPDAYRLLPYRGRLISKPVLRLMLSTRLPAPVWRRTGRVWLDCVPKAYTSTRPGVFLELLGGPDSHLVRRGIVDPRRVPEVLADPHRRHRNARVLLNSALTELFLRGHDAPRTTASEKGQNVATRAIG